MARNNRNQNQAPPPRWTVDNYDRRDRLIDAQLASFPNLINTYREFVDNIHLQGMSPRAAVDALGTDANLECLDRRYDAWSIRLSQSLRVTFRIVDNNTVHLQHAGSHY
ncbi:hypothetical protein [Entomomonas asaccharolytica]|uniref:Uncharacterized protein n=1 Tax=Entomomonas asaccharolytica TaxID=2785331 RepID=A0A974RWC5_9GAMM|nr:hypothetical protein [Entomomonas asaccharolytica]QQP85053.1 hypothetical protein JHT90_11750 [Entomomonas asaccharolytica]